MKGFKIFIAVVAVLLIIAGGVVFTFVLSKYDFNLKAFVVKDVKRDVLTITEDYSSINIDTKFGEIKLIPSDESKVDYSYTEDYTVSIEIIDGILKIDGKYDRNKLLFGNWLYNLRNSNLVLHIYIDKDILDSVNITSTNSEVEITDLHINSNFSVKTTNGKIVVKNVNYDCDAILETDNGKIDVSNGNFLKLSAKTDNGLVRLEDIISTNARIQVTNGGVWLKNISIIDIDETAEYSFSAQSTNGVIYFENIQNEGNTILSGHNGSIEGKTITSNKIALKNTNGLIKVSELNPLEFIEARNTNGKISLELVNSESNYQRVSNSDDYVPGGLVEIFTKNRNGRIEVNYSN